MAEINGIKIPFAAASTGLPHYQVINALRGEKGMNRPPFFGDNSFTRLVYSARSQSALLGGCHSETLMPGTAPRRMKLYRNPLDCALRCTTRQSGGLRYIFRTDPHAGGGATADENFTQHVILRGYRRRRAAIFRAVVHAGRDAPADEAVPQSAGLRAALHHAAIRRIAIHFQDRSPCRGRRHGG